MERRGRRFWLPPGTSTDGGLLVQTRAIRSFGDGLTSVILAAYLASLGFDEMRIGVVASLMLAGSAALTLGVGFRAHAAPRRTLLTIASLLMVGTGIGFALFTDFWPLALIGLVGTMNPSGGDVSVFLPTEQALLPETVSPRHRTALFARYSLLGTLLAAAGAGCAGLIGWLTGPNGPNTPLRLAFLAYAGLGVAMLARYRRLSPAIEPATKPTSAALGPSRHIVYRLAALFSLDSFGGGFVITTILVLWLQRRHGISLAWSGAIFFWASIFSAFSALAAPVLANRIGLIRTMAYTHLPANGFLILAALAPNATWAVACLLARSVLSQMDVPARNSYVMAVVTPEERPAAASLTSVPRSLATAIPPIAAGWMLTRTTFGWPLIIGGVLKALYDLLLLHQFRSLHPPEERDRTVLRPGDPDPTLPGGGHHLP